MQSKRIHLIQCPTDARQAHLCHVLADAYALGAPD